MQKCIYCDFLSAPADDKTKSSYVKALINEIALSEAGLDKNVTSIFIGGGTPSAINAEYIKDILEAVKQRYRVDGNAEITIECNPGTINSEKAYIYREAGINRISFGLQSTDDKELRMLGRIHTFEQFKNSLAIARNAGFTNINIDLMSALPGQTIESFTRVLKEAVSLNTEHISVYSLIIEEGTRLYDNIDNYPDIPDDDDDRKMYALTKEILGQAGYERYEISNYAKAGYECKHNLKYWDRTDYIGFGIGHPTPNKIIIYRLSRRDCMQSQNQFIPGRIVVIWPGDRYHIIRIIGKTNSEIIGLYFFIACSNRLQYIVTDTPNQSARRISRNHIRVYRIPKLMASHHLNTIIRLSIHRVIFSSHSIGNPGMSH